MKRIMLFLAAAGMAVAANARILRVSNVSGSSAPYATIADAQDAAEEGDTIMVDGSGESYGDVTIEKRIVLMGPGYYLIANGIVQEAVDPAYMGKLSIKAEGTVIEGVTIMGPNGNAPEVYASKVIFKRCYIGAPITFCENVSNCVVHQNLIRTDITVRGWTTKINELQVTNNIFTKWGEQTNLNLNNSYVAYNTFTAGADINMLYGVGNTVERNLSHGQIRVSAESEKHDNVEGEVLGYSPEELGSNPTDKAVKESSVYGGYTEVGAFAGETPYVLSGVPAGPVIQDLVVPAAVEMGSKLSVTVKVGMQQ